MYKVAIGRTTKMRGREIGNQMGVNTWAAFAGTDQDALVDGDFVMYPSEVQGALKALRKAGVDIVALHNHMIGEETTVYFLHYWGEGPATQLAEGVYILDTPEQR